MPYLRCVSETELSAIMHEVHEGFCGDHIARPSLSKKILHQGYFWLTMKKDCIDNVRKYEQCQRYAKVPWAPPTEITLMTSPWPFAVWGIDMVGSLPTGKGRVKYAIIAVDYYTKWVEAEAHEHDHFEEGPGFHHQQYSVPIQPPLQNCI